MFAPDQSSLKMKILRATFVTHCMSNCLDSQYIPLDPSQYGWKLEENRWEPIWFMGNALPGIQDIDSNIQPETDELSESQQDYTRKDTEESDESDSDYVESCDDTDSQSDH